MKRLSLQDNKNMLGTDREGTVDGCHPNDIGMMRCADALTPVIDRFLKK
jgi:lysophospholipase L1-like esterase